MITQSLATTSTYQNFSDISQDINSKQKDFASVQLQNWTEGSGNYQFNSAYFVSGVMPSGSNLTFNFQALSQEILGLNITKSWSDLRLISIENLNGSGILNIGSSGLSNEIGLFSRNEEIKESGIVVIENPAGFPLSSSNCNVRLINYNDFDISYRLLAMGVLS